MSRLEQAERLASVEDNSAMAAKHLRESVREERLAAAKPEDLDVKKEAQVIADHFAYKKLEAGEDWWRKREADPSEWIGTMDKGAKRLESALQRASGSMIKYNKVLDEVANAIGKIDHADLCHGMDMVLNDFDIDRRTYKDAYIWMTAWRGQSAELYRVVQPGNTFSQIVSDSYDRLVNDPYDNIGPPPYSRDQYMSWIKRVNNIENPYELKVGQVLKMFYTGHFPGC